MIIGHEKIKETLTKTLLSNKIFPTWIFCGSFGVGKAKTALNFAKCLLSGITPVDGSLCVDPEHSIHRLVDNRTHPDLFILEQTDENVSIDDTRNLLQKVRKMPSISSRKVIIIENTSELNKNIHNSLLKILEEPPKDTVIIMICKNIGNLPKTLLSRSSKIYFKPLQTQEVRDFLKKTNTENAEKLASLSNGSIGYAYHLKEHNGLAIFDNLLNAFNLSKTKECLRFLIDNNCVENFAIIKESLHKLFQIYVEILTDIIDINDNSHEVSVFKEIVRTNNICVESEIEKILKIISMLNRCESMMLDKNAVLVYVYEKFFTYK